MVGRQNTTLLHCIVICFANGSIVCPTPEYCASNASQGLLNMTYAFGCFGGFFSLPQHRVGLIKDRAVCEMQPSHFKAGITGYGAGDLMVMVEGGR